MGGLTEAVVKESYLALVDYCRCASGAGDEGFSETLCIIILEIYRENPKNERIIVPLLKTIELLLRSGCLALFLKTNTSIVEEFISVIRSEILESGDVTKIRVCIDVLGLLFEAAVSVDSQSLIVKQLVVLTGHKYPRIRKYAAEQLYLLGISSKIDFLLPSSDVSLDKNRKDRILEILVSTVWDSSISEARSKRGVLYSELGWTVSTEASLTSRSIARPAKPASLNADELDSYEALVREAGY
jgi:hypothetical protein